MRTVELTRGLVALVDDDDFERVSRRMWSLCNGYAATTEGRRRLYMHRFILGTRLGVSEVDHANGNKLDNRRSNLRPATSSQNKVNRPHHHNATGFRGVKRQGGGFRAVISRGPGARPVYEMSPTFRTAEEAARAFDAMALRRYGEFAVLNFPTSKEK